MRAESGRNGKGLALFVTLSVFSTHSNHCSSPTNSRCLLLTSFFPSWAEVRSPGFLHFYKDKKTANEAFARSKDPSTSTDKDALVIDLKVVMDFTIPDRKGKDNSCVDFELGHNSVRVK